jgi:hypothetical protein
MARPLATALGVDITPEANAGVGPVDFKFSVGAAEVVLAELKLISNTKYWDGPAAQLPAYLRSHDARRAWFIAVAFTDQQVTSVRWAALPTRVRNAEVDTGFTVSERRIDARRRLSASQQSRRDGLP